MIIISIIISISTAIIEIFTQCRFSIIIPYAFVVPILLMLPRIFLATVDQIKSNVTRNWLKQMELLSFGILVLNAPGSLWLHKMGFQYDRFLHFGVAFLLSIIFVLLYLPLKTGLHKNRFNRKGIIAPVFFVLLVGLFLWEGLQCGIDKVFGSQLFFDVAQSVRVDFLEDALFGLLGLFVGMLYVSYSFKKFLGMLK